MTNLIVPERRSLILPPPLRRMPPSGSPGPGRRRAGAYALPLTPSGPGTHTGLPVSDTETAYLTGQGTIPLIVAIATDGTAAGKFAYSEDYGLSFTATDAPEANQYQGLAYSPTLRRFVAVASTGTNRVAYSDDGVNWTAATAATANEWRRVVWMPNVGLFSAVAQTGVGNRVMTSPDGINWTAFSSPVDNSWYAMYYSPNLELAIAGSSNNNATCIMTSPDGQNWTARAASGSVSCFAQMPGGVIAARSQNNFVGFVSGNGISWTSTGLENSGCRSMAADDVRFVVLGPNNSNQQESTDGIAWNNITMSDFQWLAQIYLEDTEEFLAISSSPDRSSSRSSDGLTWVDTANAMPSTRTWADMQFGRVVAA